MFENKIPPYNFLSLFHPDEWRTNRETRIALLARKQNERARKQAKTLATLLFGLETREGGRGMLPDGRKIDVQLMIVGHPDSIDEIYASGHPANHVKISVSSGSQGEGYYMEWGIGVQSVLLDYRQYSTSGNQKGCVSCISYPHYSALDGRTAVDFDPTMQFRVYKQCVDILKNATKVVEAQQHLTLAP
jgi:hypothetical protein